MDFNGLEYTMFPECRMLDSFFEERNNFSNQLTLLSTAGRPLQVGRDNLDGLEILNGNGE